MSPHQPNPAFERLRTACPAILPSMLLCDFANLEKEVRRLEDSGVACLHLDVMDGNFVPNMTYGMPIVEAIRKITKLTIDVHLMISHPQRYTKQFVESGADCITVHTEAIDEPGELLEQLKGLGVAAGLAINPATPLSRITPFVELCDLVLVMSVSAGFGGQPFQPVALEKLRELRRIGPANLLLEVDGGVSKQTIGACRSAGADLFVVGSAIFREPDYGVAIENLKLAMK